MGLILTTFFTITKNLKNMTYYIWKMEGWQKYGKGEMLTTCDGLRKARKMVKELTEATGDIYQIRTKRNRIIS